MKDRTASLTMLAVFLLSLGLNLLHLHTVRVRMENDDYTKLHDCILRAHGVFVSVIVGGLFARGAKVRLVPAALATTAIVLCLAWTFYFSSSWSGFIIPGFDTGELVRRFDSCSTEATFLTAAVLNYFCGAPKEDDKPEASAGGSPQAS